MNNMNMDKNKTKAAKQCKQKDDYKKQRGKRITKGRRSCTRNNNINKNKPTHKKEEKHGWKD